MYPAERKSSFLIGRANVSRIAKTHRPIQPDRTALTSHLISVSPFSIAHPTPILQISAASPNSTDLPRFSRRSKAAAGKYGRLDVQAVPDALGHRRSWAAPTYRRRAAPTLPT